MLKDNSIKISMDGKGRALSNVSVERLWRTVNYENVSKKAYHKKNQQIDMDDVPRAWDRSYHPLQFSG